jgi:hypothetical protein
VTTDTGPPQPPADVFFERGFQNFLMALLVGVGSLLPLSALAVDSTHGWEKVAAGAAFLACVTLAVRSWRLAIIARPDQLVVRNFFRTVRISWQDIAAFETPPPYGALWKAGLGIRMKDGRLIAATAFGRNQYETGRVQAAVMRELEELRHQRAGDRAPDGQPPQPAPDDSNRES